MLGGPKWGTSTVMASSHGITAIPMLGNGNRRLSGGGIRQHRSIWTTRSLVSQLGFVARRARICCSHMWSRGAELLAFVQNPVQTSLPVIVVVGQSLRQRTLDMLLEQLTTIPLKGDSLRKICKAWPRAIRMLSPSSCQANRCFLNAYGSETPGCAYHWSTFLRKSPIIDVRRNRKK